MSNANLTSLYNLYNINSEYLHVVITPEKTQHCPYWTGLPVLWNCSIIATLPVHSQGLVHGFGYSDVQRPSSNPSSSILLVWNTFWHKIDNFTLPWNSDGYSVLLLSSHLNNHWTHLVLICFSHQLMNINIILLNDTTITLAFGENIQNPLSLSEPCRPMGKTTSTTTKLG